VVERLIGYLEGELYDSVRTVGILRFLYVNTSSTDHVHCAKPALINRCVGRQTLEAMLTQKQSTQAGQVVEG